MFGRDVNAILRAELLAAKWACTCPREPVVDAGSADVMCARKPQGGWVALGVRWRIMLQLESKVSPTNGAIPVIKIKCFGINLGYRLDEDVEVGFETLQRHLASSYEYV